jgi:hypothetical protein
VGVHPCRTGGLRLRVQSRVDESPDSPDTVDSCVGSPIQGAYSEFFRYQPGVLPSLSNEEFVRKRYACTLFRSVDDTTSTLAG